MDLSNLDLQPSADQGSDLHLEHPVTGEKLYFGEADDRKPMTIRLVGRDSKRFRRKEAEILNRTMAKQSRKASVESSEENGIELLAACTIGWSGIAFGGEEVAFSEKAAAELYAKPGYKWIREQVDRFIAERANFFPTA
jgi:hypothetical protein